MHDIQLRTWNSLWYGLQEPDWEEWEEEEDFSFRIVKKPKRKMSIHKDRKNP